MCVCVCIHACNTAHTERTLVIVFPSNNIVTKHLLQTTREHTEHTHVSAISHCSTVHKTLYCTVVDTCTATHQDRAETCHNELLSSKDTWEGRVVFFADFEICTWFTRVHRGNGDALVRQNETCRPLWTAAFPLQCHDDLCVYVCVCMCICMWAYAYMYVCIHTICMQTHMYACVEGTLVCELQIRMHVWTHPFVRVCTDQSVRRHAARLFRCTRHMYIHVVLCQLSNMYETTEKQMQWQQQIQSSHMRLVGLHGRIWRAMDDAHSNRTYDVRHTHAMLQGT